MRETIPPTIEMDKLQEPDDGHLLSLVENKIKTPVSSGNGLETSVLRAHDYVSPGLLTIVPDGAFPDMIVGDTAAVSWPFLRRWVEHNWYTDRTSPSTGFANRDEASILYNNARLFANQPSLEIGCWRGWSAVHIAHGTGMLDVVDPLLEDPAVAAKVRASFAASGVLDRIKLHPGFSPDAVDALALSRGQQWSFFFIDGNHDGDAPTNDALIALRYAAPRSMVLFHDLVSPDVAAGLRIFRDAGWRTMIYQTMQIMGVAWRGDVEPVQHTPDPQIFWTLPRHLSSYEVSGWSPVGKVPKACSWDEMTMVERRNSALLRAQVAEDDVLEARAELRGSQAEIANLRQQLELAYADVIGFKAQLNAALQRIEEETAAIHLADAEREAALSRAVSAETERRLLLFQLEHASHELATLHHVRADNEILHANCDDLAVRAEQAEEQIEVLKLTRAMQEVRVQDLRLANRRIVDLAAQNVREDGRLQALARWTARRRILFGLLRRSADSRIAAIQQRMAELEVSDVITERSVKWICRPRHLFGLLRRSARHAELLISQVLVEDAEKLRHDAQKTTLETAENGN